MTEEDAARIAARLGAADVALVYGDEADVEGRGLGSLDVMAENPSVVYARCRPSRTEAGSGADFGLLVEARAGFCSQLAGHREGPIFVDVRASGGGAALVLTASVLALLRRRVHSGRGGWAETSLYDGLLSTLGCMIGRSERAPAEVESYWEKGSTFPNFLYRCADGELLQVWFGGKGMYAALIEILGDEPSPRGYYADQVSGALGERARRWRSFFARQPRQDWIARLRGAGVACEPVLAPGDLLSDAHALEAGLVAQRAAGGGRRLSVATPIAVRPLSVAPSGQDPGDERRIPANASGALLAGVRVVDFSAFVAGPLAAQVLADLGADVIKVEPPQGEAMRAAAYAVAACQRGKRSLALDIGAAEARPVVERLLRWADVVVHNFRVGVSERLGMDEGTVARLNPQAVYCHASAFGTTGARATYPGNDALMQALTGFERAVGGAGNDPIAGTWIPIDMCGGWVAAIGVLAGLYAAAANGRGYRVATSLMGAGMLLQSGVTQEDGHCVPRPRARRGADRLRAGIPPLPGRRRRLVRRRDPDGRGVGGAALGPGALRAPRRLRPLARRPGRRGGPRGRNGPRRRVRRRPRRRLGGDAHLGGRPGRGGRADGPGPLPARDPRRPHQPPAGAGRRVLDARVGLVRADRAVAPLRARRRGRTAARAAGRRTAQLRGALRTGIRRGRGAGADRGQGGPPAGPWIQPQPDSTAVTPPK